MFIRYASDVGGAVLVRFEPLCTLTAWSHKLLFESGVDGARTIDHAGALTLERPAKSSRGVSVREATRGRVVIGACVACVRATSSYL